MIVKNIDDDWQGHKNDIKEEKNEAYKKHLGTTHPFLNFWYKFYMSHLANSLCCWVLIISGNSPRVLLLVFVSWISKQTCLRAPYIIIIIVYSLTLHFSKPCSFSKFVFLVRKNVTKRLCSVKSIFDEPTSDSNRQQHEKGVQEGAKGVL